MNVVIQAKLGLPGAKTRTDPNRTSPRMNWSLVAALSMNTAFWIVLFLAFPRA